MDAAEPAPARAIYQAAGFALVGREEHALFGVPLTGETWEIDVGTTPAPPRR
ncbi:MAG: hypothetical protein U1F58_17715 [Burkholderiales bacterium]